MKQTRTRIPEGFNRVVNAVTGEETILVKKLEINRWISVEDKLPDKATTVIVDRGIAQYMGKSIGWYSLTGIEWPGRLISWKVTHWMPLPSPPKSE